MPTTLSITGKEYLERKELTDLVNVIIPDLLKEHTVLEVYRNKDGDRELTEYIAKISDNGVTWFYDNGYHARLEMDPVKVISNLVQIGCPIGVLKENTLLRENLWIKQINMIKELKYRNIT